MLSFAQGCPVLAILALMRRAGFIHGGFQAVYWQAQVQLLLVSRPRTLYALCLELASACACKMLRSVPQTLARPLFSMLLQV